MEAVPGPRLAPPAVSVVVRTRDRPDLLRQALGSLASQTFRDFEAVVVNDSDAPLPASALEAGGASVRVVSPGPPHGRSRAANAGLEAALGRWVAYLDDDDLFLPDHLGTLAGALEGQDRFQAAFTGALLVEQVREPDGTYREVSRKPLFETPFDPGRLLFTNTIPLLCLMHRRSLVEEAGRYDESFDLYEDWDFLIRLSRLTPFLRIDGATALYRTRNDATNVTTVSPWRGEVSEAAREALFRKHWALHTPRAEMALLNFQEDEAATRSRYVAQLQESLERAHREIEAARARIGEQERLVAEGKRRIGEQERALEERALRLADAALALGQERERGAAERERASAEHVRLSAALAGTGAERDRLAATVHQMTTSLAWRLFTPWWKIRDLLRRKG